jgi:RNA polymerase sigma factor (TIGR02999 family)
LGSLPIRFFDESFSIITGLIVVDWVRQSVQRGGVPSRSDHDDRAPSGDVTALLRDWRTGDRQALDRLIPVVYRELRVMASRLMARERRDGTIQATGLVNEAYMKLVNQRAVDWHDRAHFFAIAAQVMRRVLLDAARRRRRGKRGGGAEPVPIDAVAVAAPDAADAVDVLAVDRALQDLEQLDPDQARIVELRFFGGLTVEETAVVLGISPATVKREWAVAKGWLYRALTGGPGQPAV